MEITTSPNGEVWVVQLRGKLDSFTAKEFEERLLADIGAGRHKIVIAAERLEYVSSAGLRIFYLAAQRLAEHGGKLVFCELTPHVRRVFDIVDMASEFRLCATRAEALREFV